MVCIWDINYLSIAHLVCLEAQFAQPIPRVKQQYNTIKLFVDFFQTTPSAEQGPVPCIEARHAPSILIRVGRLS